MIFLKQITSFSSSELSLFSITLKNLNSSLWLIRPSMDQAPFFSTSPSSSAILTFLFLSSPTDLAVVLTHQSPVQLGSFCTCCFLCPGCFSVGLFLTCFLARCHLFKETCSIPLPCFIFFRALTVS